ncbi:hypothetical protein Bca52824_027453 [Brassica carinata]|uniref:DUF674 family protein n=1 Tax=Brassica carinata TaxID=52824 RepID=A0A8X8AL97_BRACI|nr:hypothetical protein Bca52824_027453 [Brassica carinata]
MAKSSGETKFSLKLVVDEVNKKVVFAEACRDFVDVLFSLLTLPMGTIVRLLENHRKSEPVPVGCFSNLYKSVVDMGIDDFATEACKQMLLYPRSLRDVQCKRLKLNLHPTDGFKCFSCSYYTTCEMYSGFSSSRCRCGMLMNKEIPISGAKVVDNIEDGVFVRGRSSFIITDDLKVAVRSTDLILRKLKSVGCGDLRKVAERIVEIGLDEVMTLLECILSSNASLTDTFLNKQSSKLVMKPCTTPSPQMVKEIKARPEEVITFNFYVECGEDFVDLLFTFLAVPLESVLEIAGDISTFGCIGNLFKSFKELNASKIQDPKPCCPITINEPPFTTYNSRLCFAIDPKSHGRDQSEKGSGFMKRDTKFTVSDDLIITPMSTSSAYCFLKKLESQAEDIQVQEISISKTQATTLLRASLVTSSALNAAFELDFEETEA